MKEHFLGALCLVLFDPFLGFGSLGLLTHSLCLCLIHGGNLSSWMEETSQQWLRDLQETEKSNYLYIRPSYFGIIRKDCLVVNIRGWVSY